MQDDDQNHSPKANDSEDILKELGFEPNDDNYESPVWSDSDIQSWGDGQNLPKENEPTSKIKLCTTDSDSEVKPRHDAHSMNESQASPAKQKSDMQEGSADNKVLTK